MSAFSQRVDAAINGGMMNTEQEKPAATTAAGIGMGRESAFTRAVRNARGGTLDEVEMPQAKTPVDPEPGFWQRVFKTASGGVKQSASQYSDAARAQYEASQGGRTQRTMDELRDIEWAVANAKYAYDTAQNVGAKQSSQNDLNANLAKLKAYAEVLGDGAYDVVLREAYDTADKLGSGDAKSLYAGLAGFDPDAFNGVQQQATAATAQMADQLQQSAAEDIAQAKQGLGAAGQTLVDAGVAGTQMLGDAAANLIAPGMGKVALAQRVFGGGTQEARQHGANLAQQLGFGAASASLELLTESMFDGLAGIYGGGAADDVVEAFIRKATGSPAGRAALRVLAGAAGEGAEELVSGIVNPFLQTIYNSEALRESYGKGNLKETVSGILHDALIGTILGTVGGGANAVKSYGADAKTTATTDGAALGAEAAANGESATTATPTEERAAEAIVEGERTAAATPAELLVGSIAESAVPSAKQVNTIAKDAAAVRALGIDPNGKTASQLRAEVREALASKVKPQTEVTAEQTGEVAPQRVNVPVENVNETVDAESSVGAAEHGFDPFTAAQNEFGTLPSGEHPVRPDDVPVSVGGKDRVSQTVRTVIGAEVTPEAFVPLIENETMNGEFSYMRLSNDAVTETVVSEITEKGWETALRDWRVSAKTGKSGPNEVAMGSMLYNHAVNAGDFQLAMDILVEYQGMVRSSARALQAARIMKKLSPDKQLYMVQRSVGNLQEELNERYGRENAPELTVSNELYERFRKAETQEARDDAMRDIYRSVGKQMPSRFVDKWNAWRYLSMLGNARTHIRNIVGNAVFAPVVGAKTGIATGIEAVAYRLSGGKLERTKSPITKELWRAALADYANAQEAIQSGRKYGELENANRYVEEGRTIFKAKPLEWARKKNSELLDVEDTWFSRPQYALALAQYCAANGITAEQLRSGEVLTKARDYAIREAQKATFRDTNYLSQTLVDLGQYEGNNPVKKIVSILSQGLLPFRKTPADILARGLEYSPLGLAKSGYDAAHRALSGTKLAEQKNAIGRWAAAGSEITGADIIDHLAAGLTGSGLFALGAWMAVEGIAGIKARGADDEDEEQAAFDDLTGHQAYALELPNGLSITLDWLAPESMPFFMGVNMAQMQGEDGKPLTLRQLMTVAKRMTDPLLEMSCLQSLNDAFDAVGYVSDEGVEGLPAALASMALSYLTQAVPTLFGQVERISEDVRYTTYTGEGAQWSDQLTNDAQYNLGKMLQRVPGLDYNQIPYIDAWGREEESGDVLERAAHNLLNPAYVSKVEVDKLESELQRLYDATGDVAVLPDRAAKSFTMDGETRYLTAEEYVKFAKASGQSSYRYASEAVQSAAYRSMSDEERSELIGKLYSYAKYKAKKGIEPKYESDTYRKAAEAEKKGISPVEYYTGRMRSDADGNGTTSKAEAQKYLDSQSGLSNAKKVDLWDIICTTGAKNPYQ